MEVYLAFYLEPAATATDPLPSQVQSPLPPIIIDEPEWEVDEVVDSRFAGRTLEIWQFLTELHDILAV